MTNEEFGCEQGAHFRSDYRSSILGLLLPWLCLSECDVSASQPRELGHRSLWSFQPLVGSVSWVVPWVPTSHTLLAAHGWHPGVLHWDSEQGALFIQFKARLSPEPNSWGCSVL